MIGAACHGWRSAAASSSRSAVSAGGWFEIEPARILPRRPVEIARQRDARMRLDRQPGEARDRIGDDLVDRLALVDDAIDEGGVGAVLEQPAHQIGEQILVAADRRVDAARAGPSCSGPTISS